MSVGGRGGATSGRGTVSSRVEGAMPMPSQGSKKRAEVSETEVKVSFRDKVMGGKPPVKVNLPDDLLGLKLASVSLEDGDRLHPRVMFDATVIKEMAQPWQDSLVVKILGKELGFLATKEKLRVLWKPQHGFDVMSVGNGYFMVKFDAQEDRERVIQGGAWIVQDNYLAVKEWTPQFSPSESCFGHTMVWVKLSGLNMLYYYEKALRVIATTIGKPIRIDLTTQHLDRGRFAHVCVEVNLALPIV